MRILQLFHASGAVMGLIMASWWWLLASFIMYFLMETLGGNIGLHRYFGHNSFATTKFGHWFLGFWANLVGAGSSLSWSGTHRYHHLHSDLPSDVHSPYHQSYWKIMFGNWDVRISPTLVKDLTRDPMHRWYHRNYFLFHILIILFLFIVGWKYLIFVYCLPCALCLQSGYVLAILGHKYGYRTYETSDHSRNNWLVSLYTFGEGWHNNHHQYPQNYRQGEKWWEFDVPALVIEKFFKT